MNTHQKQDYLNGLSAVIDGIAYAVAGAPDPMAEVTDGLIFYIAECVDSPGLSFLDMDFIRHCLHQRLMPDPFEGLPR